MKKLIKRLLWILLIAVIIVLTWFAWPRLPIITAFAANGLVIVRSTGEPGTITVEVSSEDLKSASVSLEAN